MLVELNLYFYFLYQNGSFPLEIAAENGHTESVELMLKAGASVNSRNKVSH